jgi:hypothetical protein
MKKLKITKYILFLLLFALGCNKDFLDVSPKGVVNSDSFYSTKTDADQAITTIYGLLNYMQVWDQWIISNLGSVASDDAEAGGAHSEDVPVYQQVDNFTFTPALPEAFAHAYGVCYKMIFYSNIALERLPSIPTKDTTASPAYINQRLSEAKFLRAFAYYYLSIIFGEVPLVDHVLGSSEYITGRSSMRSVFDLMEKDLKEAIPYLPATQPDIDKGRITSGAAQGLLAKVYLFESSYAHYYPNDKYSLVFPGESRFKDLKERWADVLAAAEGVINSGNYELIGIDGVKRHSWRDGSDVNVKNTDGFRYVWSTDGDNCKENIFEIQAGWYGLNWLKARGSSLVWWTGARWVFDNGKPTETKYWGFNIPSASLVAEFNKEQRLPSDPLFGSLSPADPRFNTTIHKDTIGGNDSIQLGNSSLVGAWYKICYEYNGTWFNRTHTFQAKYECSYDEYQKHGPSWCESPFNNRMIRYADIVLVASEAAIMLGDQAKARKYINMVRTRARMCGAPGNTCPADYTGDITIDMLIHERRLELAMEGHRFFDLVRWNLAVKYINGSYLQNQRTTVTFVSPKNDFYPIPQAEVNSSQGKLLQYPGW